MQWEGEIHRFLRWGAFDLIPYQGNYQEATRKGVWDTISAPRSDLKGSDKIILATASVRFPFSVNGNIILTHFIVCGVRRDALLLLRLRRESGPAAGGHGGE